MRRTAAASAARNRNQTLIDFILPNNVKLRSLREYFRLNSIFKDFAMTCHLEAYELLFDQEEDRQLHQAGDLCRLVRQWLGKQRSGFRECRSAEYRNAAEAAASSPDHIAKAPILADSAIIVFDIPSLLSHASYYKYALIPPMAAARHLPGAHAAPAAGDLPALQQALQSVVSMLVFDPRQAALFTVLGAAGLRLVPYPAIAPRSDGNAPVDVLLINHSEASQAADAAVAALKSAPGISVAVIDCAGAATQPPRDLPAAHVHLHLGTPSGVPPLRIVDSFLRGHPVIYLPDRNGAGRSDDPAMRLDHNISGIRANRIADLPGAVRLIRSDPALSGMFAGNGKRAANDFNTAVAETILGVLP